MTLWCDSDGACEKRNEVAVWREHHSWTPCEIVHRKQRPSAKPRPKRVAGGRVREPEIVIGPLAEPRLMG